VAAAPAAAQSGAVIGIGGGSTIPVGSTSDALTNGPHGLLSIGFKPPRLPIVVGVSGMYHRISGDEAVVGPDIDTQVINGGVDLTAKASRPGMRVLPYAVIGGGVYNIKAVGSGVPAGTSSVTKFGLNGGVGADFKVNPRLAIFVEGRYHNVFTTGTDFTMIPISAGVHIATRAEE
jgi:hypothetical protein